MKVLFVYPVPPSNLQVLRYQQGIGSLAAVLKRAGHSAELLVLQRFDPDLIDATLARIQPHLLALSLTSNYFELGRQVARHAANQHRLPVTRTKSVWNLVRRLRAKARETRDRIAGRRHYPE